MATDNCLVSHTSERVLTLVAVHFDALLWLIDGVSNEQSPYVMMIFFREKYQLRR